VARTNAEAAVREFVARINAHDARAVVALCTADHAFTDSLGATLAGSDRLEAAWAGYFALFPDYRIDVEQLACAGNLVLAAGWASATVRGAQGAPGRAWRIPAAWRAVVRDGGIAEWQVYADNAPVRAVLPD
jgi:ketosteroid isomerase-like protein